MSSVATPISAGAGLQSPSDHLQDVEPRRERARIGLLGASGYSGQEFTRLALRHPGLDLAALFSREHAGRPVSTVLPGVDPRLQQLPTFSHPDEIESQLEAGTFDTLIACLPHGEWKKLIAERPMLASAPARLIDLSSDSRSDAPDYVYGLPETFRSTIAKASRIANPGCYPTAAALALIPAIEARWIDGPVMINALSGVSGAGRAAALRTSFVELDGGASLYKAGTEHAHVAEMSRTFTSLHGAPIEVGFAPQLAPMARGILLTANVPLSRAVTPEEARNAYLARYRDEAFVRVLPPGDWPETRAVRTSNRCDVAVTTIHGGRTLLAATAIDNLVKGAAGQAIQNLNLMLGWPENWGLPMHGTPW